MEVNQLMEEMEMKNLGNLRKTATIAAAILLLQLAATSNAGELNRFSLAVKDARRSTVSQTGVKLEINRQSSRPSTKKLSVFQAALTPKIGEIDSVIADGRTDRTRLNGDESLSKKWDRSDEFKLKFSIERYWTDQFHNEFRRSWLDSERSRASSPMDLYRR